MKTKKKLFIFFVIFFALLIFTDCTTIKFGQQDNQFIFHEDSKKKSKRIREFDLSYHYKVLGINVQGKTIIENVFVADQTIFFCISFPRIGILSTDNFGKSFTSHFFNIRFLQKAFGYKKEETEEEAEGNKDNNQLMNYSRVFTHYASSKQDPSKIALSMGPYVFLTEDKGKTWKHYSPFMDLESSSIKKILVTEKNDLIIFTHNRMAWTGDWGKRWKHRHLRMENMPFYKIQFVDAILDQKSNLYLSIKAKDELNNQLSDYSYLFFYRGEKYGAKSGVFISNDLGQSWKKTDINVPVVFWNYQQQIKASPVYSLSLYQYDFPDGFKDTTLYRTGNLDQSSAEIFELMKTLQNMDVDYLQINHLKENRLITFNQAQSYQIEKTSNIDCIIHGNRAVGNNDFIQYESLTDHRGLRLNKKRNFFYDYSPYRLFKTWCGLQTNEIVLYSKNGQKYYRIKPDQEFIKAFYKYVFLEKIRLKSINPFLKKISDIEFFNPKMDPSGGFPINIEYTSDNGQSWQPYSQPDHIKNIINPIGTKQSRYYWYKKVDKKKSYKLQVSIGSQDSVDYLIYPFKLDFYDENLLMINNYFSIDKSYKDLYIFPL